ncbi:MAG: hypothetical protein AAFR36_28200 [Bacteroidota bacterium]
MYKIFRSPFWTKWGSWEYWPVYITNIPTVLYWLYYALRSRKLFFFSVVNPVIETGGVLGESKINILRRIPAAYLPKTVYFRQTEADFSSLLAQVNEAGISFPLIVKPDIGERGFLVEKIDGQQELEQYFAKVKVDFLVQEFVDYPVEISVFYYRMPGSQHGTVSSICIKEMLTVQGDGKSTVEELMANSPRASLQLDRFQETEPELLQRIIPNGKTELLEPIGNHCRGTKFLNGNHFIDGKIHQVFDRVGMQMNDIYYGRFDMKCESMEALRSGEGFKILEFNGVAGEPAHIYDPAYPIRKAYRDVWQHWGVIYEISKVQIAKGVKPMSWGEAWQRVRDYRTYMRRAQQ